MNENDFEKFPEGRIENGERPLAGDDFSEVEWPPFGGEASGEVNEENAGDTENAENVSNEGYGEGVKKSIESEGEYNADISDAAAIINYGLNAAALKYGVPKVVETIKNYDPEGSTNPVKDLFESLGVDTPEEFKEVKEEARAIASSEEEFRVEQSVQGKGNNSNMGAMAAIKDMKELISEVEGADPRYEDLRERARSFGVGVFEYAVKDFGVRGLTELFDVLAQQRGESDDKENSEKLAEEEIKEEVNNRDGGELDDAQKEEVVSEVQERLDSDTFGNVIEFPQEKVRDIVDEEIDKVNRDAANNMVEFPYNKDQGAVGEEANEANKDAA